MRVWPRGRLLLGVSAAEESELECPADGKWPPGLRLGVGWARYASTSQYEPPVIPEGDEAAPLRPMLTPTLRPVGMVTSRNDDGSGDAPPPG